MRKLVACIFLLTLGSCGDYQIDLPGGYMLLSESPDTQMIIRKEGLRSGERYIPCNVVGYDSSEDFIIAKQVARPVCFLNGKNQFDQVEGQEYFWIIDAAKTEIHGPYDKVEFAKQRVQMRVLSNLSVEKRI